MLSFGLCSGCATGLTQRFVQTDATFAPGARHDPPTVLVDEGQVEEAMPFKAVGVLEVRGMATQHVDIFLARAVEVGTRLGCDVVAQRDLYELGYRTTIRPGHRAWRPNGEAAWQFLCGVNGATTAQARQSRTVAIASAIKMRDEVIGVSVCSRATPTGTHIQRLQCPVDKR